MGGLLFGSSRCGRYHDDGLIYFGFALMLFNPVTHCLVQIGQPPLRIMQGVASCRARTQAELNRCYRPPGVNLGEAYAKVRQTKTPVVRAETAP